MNVSLPNVRLDTAANSIRVKLINEKAVTGTQVKGIRGATRGCLWLSQSLCVSRNESCVRCGISMLFVK